MMDAGREGGRRGLGLGFTFMTGQVFTIASTIIGVYLAGYVGFQRTLEYDGYRNAREVVQVLGALEAELEDNLSRLDAHLARMRDTFEGKPLYGDWPELRLYLWDAAQQNPSVFAAPAGALTALQGFYDESARALADENSRERFRRITSSNAYERNLAVEAMTARIARAREQILPSLAQAMAAPRAIVDAYDADPSR
ncbi:MAG: hypothetical protein AAFR16_09470 [Pseudomonadota bacterium]